MRPSIWTKQVDDRLWRLLCSKAAVWFVITTGIILRFSQYLYNRSLTEGEAPLALNIIERSYVQLFKPLSYAQAAPVGFLIVEKFVSGILGSGEYALRLFPFLAGIAVVPFLYLMARDRFNKGTVIISLILGAVGDHLIYFASEVKQYSSDVAFTILIVILTLLVIKREFKAGIVLLFGFVGAITLWFSHPALFVISSSSLVLIIMLIKRKNWHACTWLGIAIIILFTSFLGNYLIALRDMRASSELVEFWQHAFMPFPPRSFADLYWYPYVFLRTFKFPLGLSIYELLLAVLAFFTGCALMYRKNRLYLALFGFPILTTLVASGLHLYPFEGRLILFLTPLILLFVAEGIEFIRQNASNHTPFVGTALVFLLLAHPVAHAGYRLIKPRAPEELRPVLEYVAAHSQHGDVIYVYYAAYNAFRYYAPRLGLDVEPIVGIEARAEWEKYYYDLRKLSGRERVWIVLSHITQDFGVDEEQLFVTYANILGDQLVHHRAPGAAAYLYAIH